MKWIPAIVCAMIARVGAAEPCPAMPGAEPIVSPGARLLVGEMHGTNETPRAVAALSCHAAKLGKVRVALELPESEDGRIAAFVGSKGRPADRKALLAGAFWQGAYQDGRRSVAMLELLEAVRRLRAGGADVRVVTFDAGAEDRDRAMAARLLAAIAREPAATFIGLAGNLHARKTAGRFGTTFMAGHLVAGGVKLSTLDSAYGRGTAWVCFGARPEDCGPQVVGRGPGEALGVVMGASPDGAYDGKLSVGVATFAPPAAVAMTPAQAAAESATAVRLDATAAYEARRYARCAARFAALARQPGGRADDAYGAACCFALFGDAGRAFAQLEYAVDRGFDQAEHAASDPDLASLRDDARWAPLFAKIRAATPK